MPIRGMTDDVTGAFPRIGTLRKGAPKPAGGGYGRDLSYFRADFGADKDATTKFAKAYGDQPQSINVFLPYRTPAENFQAWREEWTASALIRRCDGERIAVEKQGNTYQRDVGVCKAPHCKCGEVGRLSVIVPELERLAYMVSLTGSTHDIIELWANLQAIYVMRGDLRGIPFVLSRKSRMVSMPNPKEPGKRMRVEKWLLSIEPAPSWVRAQLASAQASAYPALPAAGDDAPDADDKDDAPSTASTPTPTHFAKQQEPVDPDVAFRAKVGGLREELSALMDAAKAKGEITPAQIKKAKELAQAIYAESAGRMNEDARLEYDPASAPSITSVFKRGLALGALLQNVHSLASAPSDDDELPDADEGDSPEHEE